MYIYIQLETYKSKKNTLKINNKREPNKSSKDGM